mgnify:CR=1 FL=1
MDLIKDILILNKIEYELHKIMIQIDPLQIDGIIDVLILFQEIVHVDEIEIILTHPLPDHHIRIFGVILIDKLQQIL